MSSDLAKALDHCLTLLARGEELAQCLARYPQLRSELEPLLRTSQTLWLMERAETPEQLREAGRTRLMNSIAARQRAQARPATIGRWTLFGAWPRLASALAAVMVVLLLGNGALVASANSLPGETLYRVKRAAEAAQQALLFDEAKRANFHLQLADRRLAEEVSAVEQGLTTAAEAAARDYAIELEQALGIIDRAQATGSDVGSLIDRFNQHAERHQETLTRVLDQVPDQAKPAIQRVLDDSERGQQRATTVQERKQGPPEQPGANATETSDPPGKGSPSEPAKGAGQGEPSRDGKDAPPAKGRDNQPEPPSQGPPGQSGNPKGGPPGKQ